MAVLISTIDYLASELEFKFSNIHISAMHSMFIIPQYLTNMTNEHRDNTFKLSEWVPPSLQKFDQDMELKKINRKCLVLTSHKI